MTVEHPFDIYMFQYISTRKMKMRSTSTYKRIRLDPMVTKLQLPPPPSEEADSLPVGEQCMGLVLSSDCDALIYCSNSSVGGANSVFKLYPAPTMG